MFKLFNFVTEPALAIATTTGLVNAVLILGVTFGLPVTPDQKSAIDGIIIAVVSFAGFLTSGIITRSQVTPTSTVLTSVTPVTPAAPVTPTA